MSLVKNIETYDNVENYSTFSDGYPFYRNVPLWRITNTA